MTHHQAKQTIKWYDDHAAEYVQKTLNRARVDQLEEFVELLPPHPVVLDVGCGFGRDTAILASLGCEVTGLDLSAGLIAEAHRHYPELTFQVGSMTQLPFPDTSLDGIWANASLLHLPTAEDVTTTLNEFARTLKPQGVVHIRVKAQTTAEETAVVTDELSGADRFFRYFKLDALTQLLEQAGFSILTAEQFNEAERESHLGVARADVDWIVIRAKI